MGLTAILLQTHNWPLNFADCNIDKNNDIMEAIKNMKLIIQESQLSMLIELQALSTRLATIKMKSNNGTNNWNNNGSTIANQEPQISFSHNSFN